MKKWHLWIAASIGLVVIAGMMIREFDVDALSKIDLSPRFFLGVGLAVLFFVVQNLMLTLRFRHLCQRKLSIAQGFRINVLCEFTSAVTPSAVGGSGLAFVYLNREGITMGRSIFTMFAALLADEAFLAISCAASKEAKLEGGRFWLQLMGYTSLAWLSRFAIVVAILVAFHCQGNMLVAWCRQWVMWMISILSPTPGGSGVAELMFRLYYSDFLPDASVAILAAMLWRAIFYYPFLVMGTLVLPKWIARK